MCDVGILLPCHNIIITAASINFNFTHRRGMQNENVFVFFLINKCMHFSIFIYQIFIWIVRSVASFPQDTMDDFHSLASYIVDLKESFFF